MTAAEINKSLTSARCEEIAERFVNAMAAQAEGRAGGAVTAATLVELWDDVQAWARTPAKKKAK